MHQHKQQSWSFLRQVSRWQSFHKSAHPTSQAILQWPRDMPTTYLTIPLAKSVRTIINYGREQSTTRVSENHVRWSVIHMHDSRHAPLSSDLLATLASASLQILRHSICIAHPYHRPHAQIVYSQERKYAMHCFFSMIFWSIKITIVSEIAP